MAKWNEKVDYEGGFINLDSEDEAYITENGRPFLFLKLYNFNTGSSNLFYSHKNAIYQYIYLNLRGETGYWINLVGYASKKGNPNFNKNLSLSRCISVQNEILNGNNGKNKLYVAEMRKTVAKGSEADHNLPDDDAGYWRSVRIYVHKGTPPPRKQPAPQPVTPTTFRRRFAMRLLADGSGGLFKMLGAEISFFHLKDLDDKQEEYYQFVGPSLGSPIPSGTPASVSFEGNFTNFELVSDAPMSIKDFRDLRISIITKPGISIGNKSKGGDMIISIAKIDNPKWLLNNAKIVPNNEIVLTSNEGYGLSATPSMSIGTLRKMG